MADVRLGILGGSGIGAALGAAHDGARHDLDTPFGKPSDAIVEGAWDGLPVLFLNRHGPGHTLAPSGVPYRANLFALKQLGCTHVVATGAVGSLREEMAPRHLVVADQIIDKTTRRAGTFFERAAVHAEFADPFCPVLRGALLDAARGLDAQLDPLPSMTGGDAALAVHARGCYVCMEGPQFGTRAESTMHRVWGGDLIGMTLMPEAKLAREAELPYAAVCLVTDYDAWRPRPATIEGDAPPSPQSLLEEIVGNLDAAVANATKLLRAFAARVAENPAALDGSPAQGALARAIWSDKNRIDRDEIEKLRPLWGRYFTE